MVTRLPGTFGSACEEIGSTTSCEPVTLLAQSGSMMAETASIVVGSILPMTKAQARPATMARQNERKSPCCDDLDATDICVSPCVAQDVSPSLPAANAVESNIPGRREQRKRT